MKNIKNIYDNTLTNYEQFPIDVMFVIFKTPVYHSFFWEEVKRLSMYYTVAVYETKTGMGFLRAPSEEKDFKSIVHGFVVPSVIPTVTDATIKRINNYKIIEIWEKGEKR